MGKPTTLGEKGTVLDTYLSGAGYVRRLRKGQNLRWVVILCAAVVLVGCNFFQSALDSREEVQFSKQFIALVQEQDFSAIEARLNPQTNTPDAKSVISQLATAYLNEKPQDIAVTGYHVFSTTGAEGSLERYDVTLEYQLPTKWLLAEIVLDRRDGKLTVAGFHIYPLPESLEVTNRFTLRDKPITDYVVLAIAIFDPILIVYTLVLCWRTPILKRKWLWIIFVLLGVVQFTVNWTTGALTVNLVSIQLLGAGFFRGSVYAPVFLSVSVPVGAIVFLIRRHRWLRRADPPEPSAST